MAQIVLEHLTKDFPLPTGGSIRAVRDLTLSVAEGEWLVLVGPSGCGKTTTLRLVAGLEEPTSGTISMNGKNLQGIRAKDRNFAMVFQNPALYPHLTVYQNMSFGLRIRRCPKIEIEQRIHSVAEILGLLDCLERRPSDLSGGQRQRVALGRALVRRPEVLLLDEPLSNLDTPTRAQLRSQLLQLRDRLATTVLHVTHDQYEAMTLGHRLGVLKDGALLQLGTPQQLYQCPANLFVAGFLGSPPMNFLRGHVEQRAEGLLLRVAPSPGSSGGLALQLDGKLAPRLGSLANKQVVLGIRPEHVSVAGPPSAQTIDGLAESIEESGPDKYVRFKIGADTIVARFPSQQSVQSDEKVRLHLDMASARFFEPDSGAAIL